MTNFQFPKVASLSQQSALTPELKVVSDYVNSNNDKGLKYFTYHEAKSIYSAIKDFLTLYVNSYGNNAPQDKVKDNAEYAQPNLMKKIQQYTGNDAYYFIMYNDVVYIPNFEELLRFFTFIDKYETEVEMLSIHEPEIVAINSNRIFSFTNAGAKWWLIY